MAHDLSDGPEVLERMAGVARRALPAYGLDGADVTLLNVSENATFRVTADDRTAVLRVHRHGYHDLPAIHSELAWLDALRAEAGVPTPRFFPAVDGRPVVTVEDPGREPRNCVLFEFLPGTEPTGDFEDLGEITARMHQHARSWTPPSSFRRFRWDFDAAFGAEARWGQWRQGPGIGRSEREILTRLESVLKTRLAGLGTERHRFGLIHGDLRQANLLVHEGRTAVIDFDDCGYGWFAYDLAAALSFIEHEPRVPELIDSWLRGYRRVCEPVDEAEIQTFILYRRLLLTAWIGSHSAADIAGELGAPYTAGTCDLAENYLRSSHVHPA